MIDLRSDTVTRPTPAMRKAIAEAEVGDDVFGDDPSVLALERAVCEILGKEAAMFVPSGTMANQLAVRLHTQAGDEALLDGGSHIAVAEAGAAAALGGVTLGFVNSQRGIFGAAALLSAMKPPDVHRPPPTLVCVENTHNVGGGSIWPVGELAEVARTAKAHCLKLHMDGARLWNAAVASGTPEHVFAGHCDTVSVCFSKGLGAPVGSALAGPAPLIGRGRRFRKMLGGGMRQSGLLAAGALYALQNHRQRLAEDHAHARTLAHGLEKIDGVEIDPPSIVTNIVRFRVPGVEATAMVANLRQRGLLLMATGPDSYRAVLHLDVKAADVPRAIKLMASGLKEVAGAKRH